MLYNLVNRYNIKSRCVLKKAVVIVLLAIAICFSYSFFGTEDVAYAADTPVENGTYRAAADITVYIWAGGVEKALFTIPNTYYFDVIGNSSGLYYINYDGSDTTAEYYVKSDANFVPLGEKDVGTLGGFTVELALTADSTFNKRISSTRFQDDAVTVAKTTSVSFIGFGKNFADADCAYVRYNNASYGYLPVANLKIKDTDKMLADYKIDFHPNYRTTVSDNTNDKTKEPIDNAKLIRIILIVGIVVPALVILFLLFKPSKKSRYDYDRNRGYDSGYSPYDRPRSRYRDDYDDGYGRPAPRRRDDYGDDYDDRGQGGRY